MIEADLGTRRVETLRRVFFFFGGWGRGGRRVMVGMMMSLAGKTAELGVFRSFILTSPTEIDTYSLPYHRGTPPPPRNTLASGCP